MRISSRVIMALTIGTFLFCAIFYARFHLGQGRFYDERFAFQNVHAVLERGALEPANGYYPTLSYLPQTLLLAAADAAVPGQGGGSSIYRADPPPPATASADRAGAAFTPLAYGISRGVQILWGLATLAFLYRLGCHAFDRSTALLAIALLAFSPWFLQIASKFKPDASLLATSVLALWLSAFALDGKARCGPYVAAGAAIAAAMSAKLTGGLVAVPLALLTALRLRAEPRRLLYLGAAGATSLVLFLAANPHLGLYRHYLERLSNEYQGKASTYGGTRLGVVGKSLALVIDETGFGWLFGGLSLVGFLAMGVWLLAGARRSTSSRSWGRRVMWLFVPVYVVAYAAKTPHFKPNNVLAILPPLALFGAWAAMTVVRWLAPRLDRRSTILLRLVQVVLIVAVAGFLISRAWTYVYQSTVPTTHDVGKLWLRAEGGRAQLHLIATPPPAERYAWEGRGIARMRSIASFSDLLAPAPHEPPVFDGFLVSSGRATSAAWTSLAHARRTTVEAAWGSARGPSLEVAVSPWRRRGKPVEPRTVHDGDRLRVMWPADAPPGWYSVEIWLPIRRPPAEGAAITVGDSPLPLAAMHAVGDGQIFTSPRFRARPARGRPEISLDEAAIDTRDIAFALYRWRPPKPPDAAAMLSLP